MQLKHKTQRPTGYPVLSLDWWARLAGLGEEALDPGQLAGHPDEIIKYFR